ncbi:hypothetical protein [Kitasatospora aureofaciens]|uniref:hypothetical protein n=1 Tax=Kitasatospora aureofaciens TaxID=1894 RepID=UPI0037CA3237
MPATVKMSDQTYPGFGEFRNYFQSCSAAYPRWAPDITNDAHKIAFEGTAADMEAVLNSAQFRFMWSLLPAGTNAVMAFVWLYALKYPKYMGLQGVTGTYALNVHVWHDVVEVQNEAQLKQQHTFAFQVGSGRSLSLLGQSDERRTGAFTVCL